MYVLYVGSFACSTTPKPVVVVPGIRYSVNYCHGSRSVSMKLQGGCAIHRHKSLISSETIPCHRDVVRVLITLKEAISEKMSK